MKEKLKKLLLVPLLAVCAAFSTGCVAVAVGAAAGGTIAYVRGELEVTYDYELERVYLATRAAVDDLGFSLVSDRGDRTGGEIIARTARDQRVQITMIPVADRATEVKIRVGAFGDQELSVRIHDAIRKRL